MSEVGKQLGRFKTICSNIRETYKQAVELKKSGATKDQIKECCTKASILLLELKSSNRATILATENAREKVREKKKEMDAIHLRLQNKLYEQNYLQNEIRRCQDFTTTEMDKIKLMPDTEVPQIAWGNSGEDPHRRHMARLQHELEERKRMKKEVSDLKRKTEQTARLSEEKMKFLNGLPEQLKSVEKATIPLQKYISLPTSKKVARQGAAHRLSTPLYVLFCQLEAHVEAFESMEAALQSTAQFSVTVDIVNSVTPPAEVTEGTLVVATSTSVSTASSKSGKKRGRDDDDASEPTSKRLKTSSGSGTPITSSDALASNAATAMSAKQVVAATSVPPSAGLPLYAPDPTAVVLTLALPKEAAAEAGGKDTPSHTLQVRFQYLPSLKVVTAQVEEKSTTPITESILCDLFPGDSGDAMPHVGTGPDATAALVACGGLSTALPGRPYKWLQWVAGLYRNELKADEEGTRLQRQQASTKAVLERLYKRVRSRQSLAAQLKTLSSTPSTIPLPPALAALFPPDSGKDAVTFTGWNELKSSAAVQEAFTHMGYPNGVEDMGFADGAEAADGVIRLLASTPSSGAKVDRRSFFRAQFKHESSKGGSQAFGLLVEVQPGYPLVPPRFLLEERDKGTKARAKPAGADVTYNNLLKDVEAEVNAYYNELLAPGLEDWLLSCQLRRVQMCFGVLATTMSGSTKDGSMFGASPFNRIRRGRDRRRTFMMDPASKALVHR